MRINAERKLGNWWADGDTPVRTDSRINYLVDGRTTLFTMCTHFLKARRYIYLANWGMTPAMELVRGTDQRAGPDGSPEQEALLARLHAEGLDAADIDFWCTHDLSVQAVLGYAVSKGVEVKALLWDTLVFPGLPVYYYPKEAKEQLEQVGVTCILDDSARGIMHHPMESLHQKISVVDGMYAFVGGIDLMIDRTGDFDRWDNPSHPFSSPLRHTWEDSSPHPWHDIHSIIEGPGAGDVELNFRQRWNDVVERRAHERIATRSAEGPNSNELLLPEHPRPPALESKSVIQLARTIPKHTYSFDPEPGIQDIAQIYAHAFSNAQRFIYLENQYFWQHSYLVVDVPVLGADSPEMERNIHELAAALRRGAHVAMLLPDHPQPGRAFTDAGLTLLREEAGDAAKDGRLQAFCLGASTHKENGEHYRPIYVHAKIGIVDDLWSTVGSANLNNRGMRDDTEMNVAVLDAELARSFRLRLWAEHLGLANDADLWDVTRYLNQQQRRWFKDYHAKRVLHALEETLGDPLVGLRFMRERAEENLQRYKAKQPLVGHLLPYLTGEEATQQGLPFREECGWLEEPSTGGHKVPHSTPLHSRPYTSSR